MLILHACQLKVLAEIAGFFVYFILHIHGYKNANSFDLRVKKPNQVAQYFPQLQLKNLCQLFQLQANVPRDIPGIKISE